MAYIFGKFGMSNAGNTSGTSGTVNRQIIFAGGNNVTLNQSINGSSASLTISAANQTVQTQNMHNLTIGSNTAGVGVAISSGTLTLAGGNNVTLSQNGGNAITINAGGGGNVNFSAGTTSNNLAAVTFSNSNGMEFGLNGSVITASHNGITSQTNQNIGIYAVGNTTQSTSGVADARSLSFNGLGGVSVGYSNGSVQISGATGGAGGGGIALANAQTTYSTGTAYLSVSAGAMTISSTANGASQSYNFSVPQTSSLSATGGVSISTNGSTISIGAPAYSPMSNWIHNSAAMYSSSTLNMVNASVSLVRMLIPEQISFSRVELAVSVSGATQSSANTAAMALSAVGVIYSRNNSTLNPIIGQSSTSTYSYASNTGVYASVTGARLLSFNLATSLPAGEYYFGVQLSSATSSIGTATTNLAWSIAPVFGTSYTVLPWQNLSAASATSINMYQPLQGVNTVSISNTSQTMQQSQINHSGTLGARANMVVIFRNN
jgi:hypothetical protein